MPSYVADGLDSGTVAGIVIGVLAGVVLLVVVSVVLVKKYKESRNAEQQRMNLNFNNPTYAREDGPITDMFTNPYTEQHIDSVDLTDEDV